MSIIRRIRKLAFIDKDITNVKYDIQLMFRENLLNYSVLNSKELGITSEKYCKEKIIVSLTTYGKRLHQVYLTIESLLQQSLKPNKIILWLDDSYQKKQLPQLIKRQIDRGLEIEYCKDIRSYKKLIPALQKYPDDIIITADDDLYYNINMIENLVSAYLQEPGYIYFNRGHKMILSSDNTLNNYLQWEIEMTSTDVSPLNFPTGGAGVLYFPHCFNNEIFNETVFLDICPYADDVWFKAMSLYNGVQCKRAETLSVNGVEYFENPSVQDNGLWVINNFRKQNDVQIRAVFEKYDLYKLLLL